MIQKEIHQFEGMNRDNNPMIADPSSAYEIRNMRITVNDTDNSFFVLTNEKGPLISKTNDGNTGRNVQVVGTYLGHAILNNYVIIFSRDTSNNSDHINVYTADIDGNFYVNDSASICKELVANNVDLGFSVDHPIETISLYENDKMQKVYWVDGINQPRVINIVDKDGNINTHQITKDNSTLLNFAPKIELNHDISITKNDVGGSFPTGTIQYFFSYFKYGLQESHLFDISSLFYLSKRNRGDETTQLQDCSFSIKLTGLDSNYDYVRCYAITKTSVASVPVCRIVGDYAISNNSVTIYDTGMEGSTKDARDLFFIGSQNFIAGTLTAKDQTLFLGNLQLKRTSNNFKDLKNANIFSSIVDTYVNYNGEVAVRMNGNNYTVVPGIDISSPSIPDTFYGYNIDNNRSSRAVKRFKSNEYYKYGVVFQLDDGSFTEVLPLGVKHIEGKPIFLYDLEGQNLSITFSSIDKYKNAEACYLTPAFSIKVNNVGAVLNNINNVKKVFPVIAYPTLEWRSCITQGFLSPTVFKINDRYNDNIFSQASWIYRYFCNRNNEVFTTVPNAYHYGGLYSSMSYFSEMYNCYVGAIKGGNNYRIYSPFAFSKDKNQFISANVFNTLFSQEYLQDCNIITLNSPESELGLLDNIDLEDAKLRIVGFSSFVKRGIENIEGGEDVSESLNFYSNNLDKLLTKQYIYTEVDPALSENENETSSSVASIKYSNNKYSYGTNANLHYLYLQKYYHLYHIFPYPNGYIMDHVLSGDNFVLNKGIKSNINCGYTDYQAIKTKVFDNLSDSPQLYNSRQVTPIVFKYSNSNRKTYYGNVDQVKNVNSFTCYKDDGNDRSVIYQTYKGNDIIDLETIINSNLTIQVDNWDNLKEEEKKANKYKKGTTLSNSKSLSFYSQKDKIESASHETWTQYVNINLNKIPSVHVQYRSTPHVLIPLKSEEIVESIGGRTATVLHQDTIARQNHTIGYTNDDQSLYPPFWNTVENGDQDYLYRCEYLSSESSDININIFNYPANMFYAGLFIGELYRPHIANTVQNGTYMGGEENEPYLNWCICGEGKLLTEEQNTLYIDYVEGDCYVGRYDSMKTYPYSEASGTTGYVEIYSSELESWVNLDERIDKNRGLEDNTTVRPYSNFNIFDENAYNQSNNFMTHHVSNQNQPSVENFPNQITWSLGKVYGEDVDSWTQISLTSLLDLDGDKGSLNYLNTWNDSIQAFQDKAIALIGFNERVQIPTSDNNPIQITNGYKVSGKSYISDKAGCINKWSIVNTESGVFFIDNLNSRANMLAGSSKGPQIVGLSTPAGMQTYFNEINDMHSWNAKWDTNAVKCYYDNIKQEIYIVGPKETLLYSFITQTFTSLLDYNKINLLENINSKLVGIYDTQFIKMFHGKYNAFVYKNSNEYSYKIHDYSIEFYSNLQGTPMSKIFHNIEWHTSMYDTNNNIEWDNTWDTLSIETPLQKASHDLVFNYNSRMSNLEKKFNVWRTYFPRVKNSRGVDERISYQYALVKLSSKLTAETEDVNKANKLFKHYNTTIAIQPR